MKLGKNPIAVILSVLFAAALIASCATPAKPLPPEPTTTTTTTTTTTVPTPPPSTVSRAELDKLFEEATALKKKALDLKLFEVLPEEYKSAEASFAESARLYESKDEKDAEATKASLSKTIGLYKELIAKGVVELAAARRKDAETMKATALKAGADTKTPDRIEAGDKTFAEAAALVDSSKHEEAIAVFVKSRLTYELAWKRSTAGDLRQKITDNDYAKWDSGNFSLAENKYLSEEGLWASGTDADRSSGVDALDEAILRYNLVIQKGRQSAASASKESSDGAKARSEAIKAHVATKDLYDAALQTHNEGLAKLNSQEFEDALAKFKDAESQFEQATKVATEKRTAALEAMKAAETAGAESQRKAQEADPLVPEPFVPDSVTP